MADIINLRMIWYRLNMYICAVVGPPGAGKSTFCLAMAEFMRTMGRSVSVINLDPANDEIIYDCDINIMESESLGPNGAMVYCMEFLEANISWLLDNLKSIVLDSGQRSWVLLDCPGQIELFTSHPSLKRILKELEKGPQTRLMTVNLIDSHYCCDPGKFIATVLTSLNIMAQLETPHLNLLSKADLLKVYGSLPYQVEYFTEVLDLHYLLDWLSDDPFASKFKKMTKSICDVIEDYSLVNFRMLSVQDRDSMQAVVTEFDKITGYCFGPVDAQNVQTLMSSAMSEKRIDMVREINEQYEC